MKTGQRRHDSWAERDCDQCMQPFTPLRKGQRLCQWCFEQEHDAVRRRRFEEGLQ